MPLICMLDPAGRYTVYRSARLMYWGIMGKSPLGIRGVHAGSQAQLCICVTVVLGHEASSKNRLVAWSTADWNEIAPEKPYAHNLNVRAAGAQTTRTM